MCMLLISNAFGYDCSGYCRKQGSTKGKVIGTAPFCDVDCSDCPNSYQGACKTGVENGSECLTGYKVCCCLTRPPTTKRPTHPRFITRAVVWLTQLCY